MERSARTSHAGPSGQTSRRKSTRGSRLAAAAERASTGNQDTQKSTGKIGVADKNRAQPTRRGSRAEGRPTPPKSSIDAVARPSHRKEPTNGSVQAALPPRGGKKRGASWADASAAGQAADRVASRKSSPRTTTAVASKKKRTTAAAAAAAAAATGELDSEEANRGRGPPGLVGCEAAMLATLLPPVPGRKGGSEARDQVGESERADAGGEVSSPCPLGPMFLALDQVLPLFRRRRQATLLKQVRAAVEGMCGRSFTRQHLAQLIFVQPDAYKLSSKTEARPTRGGYHLRDLLIEMGPGGAEGSNDATNGGHESRNGGGNADRVDGSACSSSSSSSGGGGRDGGSRSGSGAASVRRREHFLRLLAAARARHCKCDVGVKEDSSVRECSCVPEAPLPSTSPLPVEGYACPCHSDDTDEPSTGVEFGDGIGGESRARGLTGSSSVGEDVEGSDAPKDVGALRERLRQRDVLSALERNKTGEEKEADRRRKGNLAAMADAVRSFFAHSRRTTCSLDALVEALSGSSRHALSSREARERVRMLADVVPEWCTIVAPPPGSVGRSGAGLGGVDDGMVAQSRKSKEVVRVNMRIHFGEVRQMIVFMAGGGGGGRGASF